MTFSVESVICRLVGSCMSGHLPSVLCHVSWKNHLPGSKAVTVLGRVVTNICICAFKVGSFGSLLSRSFFRLTWLRIAGKWSLMQESANRHTTDSTDNVIQNNFYRFLRGFQRFCQNSWNSTYWTIQGLEKHWKREKKCTKITGSTVTCEEKTVSFKSRVWSVWAKAVLKESGWSNLIHLDRVRVGCPRQRFLAINSVGLPRPPWFFAGGFIWSLSTIY